MYPAEGGQDTSLSGSSVSLSSPVGAGYSLECERRIGTFSYMSNDPSQGLMRVVALETSGRFGSIAAVSVEATQAKIVGSLPLPTDNRTAQTLIPSLMNLLEISNWRVGELDMICATTGPGSFTGLRIGVTTAKTLAYAIGAKLVGVHTLAAMASTVDSKDKRVWAILDAQRNEIFAACFQPGWQKNDGHFPDTIVVGADDFLSRIRPGDLVMGPPLSEVSERIPNDVLLADASLWYPTAEAVALVGIAALGRGNVSDPMQFAPHYYRISAAEENARARH